MDVREERALRVSAMLTEANVLAMESKRLGRKLAAAGIIHEDELETADDLADRADYMMAVR